MEEYRSKPFLGVIRVHQGCRAGGCAVEDNVTRDRQRRNSGICRRRQTNRMRAYVTINLQVGNNGCRDEVVRHRKVPGCRMLPIVSDNLRFKFISFDKWPPEKMFFRQTPPHILFLPVLALLMSLRAPVHFSSLKRTSPHKRHGVPNPHSSLTSLTTAVPPARTASPFYSHRIPYSHHNA
ncbi:hypothetical protein PIB30_053054 [Stylosanthes scabra]|uniref:Uncharacterized protein n=1 Tax=Stylosanthes scabra TaxID=79078 RepID=A0ABU6VJE0_9FABA|nr:hypothetical protein [Stylosanthes scabra]